MIGLVISLGDRLGKHTGQIFEEEAQSMLRVKYRARDIIIFYFFFFSGMLPAVTLTGSGTHLPLPSPNPGDPASVNPAYVDNGGTFTGTWSPPANSTWHGTFTGTGLPPGTSNPGFSTIDFTGLSNGALPAKTIFILSDLDAGTGSNELITLKAFDASLVPLPEWLETPSAVSPAATASDTPAWDWSPNTNTYTFDGSVVPGNPNIAIYIESNRDIHFLEVFIGNIGFGFGIRAPDCLTPLEIPLTGSGTHLPLPSPNPGDPVSVNPVYVDNGGSFTGTWSPPASPSWYGTFTGTGLPPGTSNPGFSTIDFTGLNDGALPVGTIFVLSDLDAGTGSNELITLKAFDASLVPLQAWLNKTFAMSSTATASDMPAWDWNSSSSTYTFDGSVVPGNPNIVFYMRNNQEIHSLEVFVGNIGFGFAIRAPDQSCLILFEDDFESGDVSAWATVP